MSRWFAIAWPGGEDGEGPVVMLDQRRLPLEEVYVSYDDVDGVAAGIRDMVIRGAPAIGIAAAMGMALAVARAKSSDLEVVVEEAARKLATTRPTAVNLFWAIERMRRVFAGVRREDYRDVRRALVAEARRIMDEDVAVCRAIGRHGADLVPDGARILTHCNAGALATGGYGTALGVIRAAAEQGKRITVLADETRPYLQGARLTAWELQADGIDVTVIADVAAGHLLSRGEVDLVVVGSDRTAANGDVCNKIGSYTLAVLCREAGVPWYAAVPVSTVDLSMPSGEGIPIEERPAEEVESFAGSRVVPPGVRVRNPAFDVTPARLVSAIITERGVARPPYEQSLRPLVRNPGTERA